MWTTGPRGPARTHDNDNSHLVKHLIRNHGATKLSGKVADMAYQYNSERIACFDVTRAQAGPGGPSDHLYSFAEELKNGDIVSGKYVSCEKDFDAPHVVFFSNYLPDEGKWSKDRVHLIDLSPSE